MKFILALIFFSTAAFAQGDQVIIDGGVGVGNSEGMRLLSVGIQEDLWYAFKHRLNVGGWIDNAGGKLGSGLVSGQVGFEVNNNGTVASIFSGPCLITSPDILLGGYFQFMTDFHLGIQDRDLNYIGILYRHISSAGIESPNIGRDMIGIEIRYQ